jgi:glyoxylase-like metal-dependent hydrolase (beta-lactamase superfamily II)
MKALEFNVGTFKCTLVPDGTFAYHNPGTVFAANAPRQELSEALRRQGIDLESWHEYATPYPCLLVDTGQQRVLVDTGAGGLAPTTGRLIQNLRAAGTPPEEIDVVVVTHAHPDHIGGAIDGEGRLAFPNARYVMHADEWAFWTSAPDLSSLPVGDEIKELILGIARSHLSALQDQIDLIEGEAEIVPGIQALAAPGHTPGQIAISISSQGQQLLCTSDLVLLPIHVERPEWYAAVDLEPERCLASKRRFLELAASGGTLVHGFHFPWPGLGHVTQSGETYTWEPRRRPHLPLQTGQLYLRRL